MTVLTDEQEMLKDAARTWVAACSPVSAYRKLHVGGDGAGYDVAAWKAMADMGWAGVVIPERYGGTDIGCRSMGLILEEAGRTLTASPLLASGLAAASALVVAGTEAQKRAWLPGIADGSIIATLAVDEGVRHAPDAIALIAEPRDSGYALRGGKTFVLEGMTANLLVVAARVGGSATVALFLVPTDDPNVIRRPLKRIDKREAAAIDFDGVEVGAESLMNGGREALDTVLDIARAGMAAEMLGAASQAFAVTLDYLKTRVQFGQPIGAFQALQHRAARMVIDLELARSTVAAAFAALDDASGAAPELVSLAKATIGDALTLVTNEMVQMHGGIGMTEEHDAGLYLKRAWAMEASFGNSAFHRDRYASLRGY